MYGMGLQELIVVLILIIFIIFPLYLPFLLKKRFPNRLWIGLTLCFISGSAQFYLTGGLKYFIALAILYVFLKMLIGNDLYALLIDGFFSAGVMYWRFLKLREKPWLEKV